MAKREVNAAFGSLKELLSGDADFVREAVREYLQDVLEEEMTAALRAAKGERSMVRLGYRSGYYERALVTRVGRLELRVPQDRDGRFDAVDDGDRLFARLLDGELAMPAEGNALRSSRPAALDDIDLAPRRIDAGPEAGEFAIPEDRVPCLDGQPVDGCVWRL